MQGWPDADYANAHRHSVTVHSVTAFRPLATLDQAIEDLIEHVKYVAQLSGSTDHIGFGTDMSLGMYPDHTKDSWGEPSYPKPFGDSGEVATSDVRSPKRAHRGCNNDPHVLDFADKQLLRGYSESDVGKILGDNFLRVFAQVWK